jgi:hypothetical protein
MTTRQHYWMIFAIAPNDNRHVFSFSLDKDFIPPAIIFQMVKERVPNGMVTGVTYLGHMTPDEANSTYDNLTF